VRVDGEPVLTYEVGPFYAERLPAYHSLDVRVSRRVAAGRGTLEVFLDVQNLYDRDNPRGLRVEDYAFRGEGPVFDVDFDRERWLGLLPSLGVAWEF
jgi:hypothetical protein